MLKATLIGNLGGDPDMRYSANGSPLLRFNVAANHRARAPEGEWQDRTEWVRVTVTGARAESLSQHLKKGSRVYVEGRLEAHPWTDQQGQIRPGLDVLANEVQFMSSRPGEGSADTAASVADERRRPMPEAVGVNGGRNAGGAAAANTHDDLEDLPF